MGCCPPLLFYVKLPRKYLEFGIFKGTFLRIFLAALSSVSLSLEKCWATHQTKDNIFAFYENSSLTFVYVLILFLVAKS